MHEARFLALLALQRFQHAVDVAANPRTALGWDAARLVEHEDGRIFVDHHAFDQVLVRGTDRRRTWRCLRLRGVSLELRRNADHLPRLQAVARAGALAIDANLAGAEQFLQRTVTERRIMALEPAIETHARVLGVDSCGTRALKQSTLTFFG